jgi:signal transduction histidine kinase
VDTTPKPEELGDALAQLALINRITTALSASMHTGRLTETIAAILLSPRGLHFSRVFLLVYDEARECFRPGCARGIADESQAQDLRKRFEAEHAYLAGLSETMAAHGDHGLTDLTDRLKASALWIEAMQSPHGEKLDIEDWNELCIMPGRELPDSLFVRLAESPGAILREQPADVEALPSPLDKVLALPFAACSVHTSKGVRLAILVDRVHQKPAAITRADLSLLDWFQSQLSLAWAGFELYTELKDALDELRQLDTLKSNFLATVSHELRTPLTAIHGFLDLLREGRLGPVTDTQKALLDRSRRQSDHLLGLVNDLIDLAQYQVEPARLLPVTGVDAHECLAAALTQLSVRPHWNNARIVTPPKPERPVLVMANKTALERILYHLLDNALKFSRPGTEIQVSFTRCEDNWHLSIADQGIGLEAAQLRKVFSHFYQVDSRLSRDYPGMGIGLTLVKMQLQASGGRILVESEPQKGSVFSVVYPRWASPG